MRDALVRVKGVKKVEVSLEKQQAVVTYDPKVASVARLTAAAKAKRFGAKVHR